MGLYQLRQDADGVVLVYNFVGEQVIKLEGGTAGVIVLTYQNLSQYEHRGDDYMAGVIQGIMHCHLLRPDAFSPLPSVPSIGPSKEVEKDAESDAGVFSRPECPFHYCDQPAPYVACQQHCHHRSK